MRAAPTFSEKLDLSGRLIVAYLLIAVLFILNVVSIPFPVTGAVKAPLVLMAIYYWAIYRPTLLPVWLVFFLGITLDFLSGFHVGVHAFVFVAVRWIVGDQRRFLMGQPFVMTWIGFCLVSLVASIIQWVFFGFAHMNWAPVGSIWPSVAFGVFLFPLVNLVLHMTHKVLPAQNVDLGSHN